MGGDPIALHSSARLMSQSGRVVVASSQPVEMSRVATRVLDALRPYPEHAVVRERDGAINSSYDSV